MPDPLPNTLVQPKVLVFLSIIIILLALFTYLLVAPIDFYLTLNAKFYPQAITVGNNIVSWDQIRKELNFVSFDSTLKTRGQKLQQAINLSVERTILSQTTITSSESLSNLSDVDKYQTLKKQIEQDSVNWRTGGIFIARFNVYEATESAAVLKQKAYDELLSIQSRLKTGEDMKKMVEEANNNPTLKYLDQAAFLPGIYIEKVTEDQFPLTIKTFRDSFFSLSEGTVSDIITLSWDDYAGADSEGFKGEFGYGVARVDKVNLNTLKNFEDWMDDQKRKLEIKSYVFMPFYFKWL